MSAKQLAILNRSSGKADNHADLDILLAKRGMKVVEMIKETDLVPLLADACRSEVETVVAAGGDGTVNAIVNALMAIDPQRRPKLAILPLGTANDFAGTLCIPDEINEAIALLDTDQHVPVDVVRINAENYERYYANVAAGGNSVRVSEAMTEEMKARWGAFCYLRGGMEVLGHLETFCISAHCDGEQFDDFEAWAVMVANGKTNAGRIAVAPQASPVDGLLDVVLIRDGSIVDMVEIVSGALLGSYLECDQVEFRQTNRLRLRSHPGMRFTIDGEVIEQEPVEFQSVSRAIESYVGTPFLLEHQDIILRQVDSRMRHPLHLRDTQNA